MTNSRAKRRKCRHCRSQFVATTGRHFCSRECADIGKNKATAADREPPMSAAEVDWLLTQAVRRETMMPWEKHPVAPDHRDFM